MGTASAGPFYTGFVGTSDFLGPEADLSLTRARDAGASLIRVQASWASVAPTRPESDPRDPANPAYSWASLDATLKRIAAQRLTPIVDIVDAPKWAWTKVTTVEPGDGSVAPSVRALGDFAAAAAARYSGRTSGVQRAKYWQLWNEPNLTIYLKPQYKDGAKPFAPGWYRAMANAFYREIHAARPDNLVIAGGLAPFKVDSQYYVGMAPLSFMRTLLCMSGGSRPKPTCGYRTAFDIWSTHPYTSGGPTHEALNPDDVSMGDLPEMRRLLDAAVKAGHVATNKKVQFWVTEFSWDSQPGDAGGVPLALHARWIAEAQYRMWQNGVSAMIWYELRDEPRISGPDGLCQCGLWLRGPGRVSSAKPKPLSIQAFRFPFVAFAKLGGTATYWGRTPDSGTGTVVIEQKTRSAWTTLGTTTSTRRGIFSGSVHTVASAAPIRARLMTMTETSVPFSLVVPPDHVMECAFGTC